MSATCGEERGRLDRLPTAKLDHVLIERSDKPTRIMLLTRRVQAPRATDAKKRGFKLSLDRLVAQPWINRCDYLLERLQLAVARLLESG